MQRDGFTTGKGCLAILVVALVLGFIYVGLGWIRMYQQEFLRITQARDKDAQGARFDTSDRVVIPKGQYNFNQILPSGQTPLIWAAANRQGDLVKLLLRLQTDVNGKDKDGRTALSYVASSEDIGIATLLLNRGANVNAADNSGMTPLMWACRSGSVPLVRLLIEKGADANRKDKKGKTARAMTERLFQNYKKTLEVLATPVKK